MSIKRNGNFFSDTDLVSKSPLTEKQKRKIFEKYTKHFSDFMNGKYCEKATCICSPKPKKEEDCDCRISAMAS